LLFNSIGIIQALSTFLHFTRLETISFPSQDCVRIFLHSSILQGWKLEAFMVLIIFKTFYIPPFYKVGNISSPSPKYSLPFLHSSIPWRPSYMVSGYFHD
ncbi:MAG: hypothetical protein ACPGJS_24160, partial [Flammeovirgaceae bacterium]